MAPSRPDRTGAWLGKWLTHRRCECVHTRLARIRTHPSLCARFGEGLGFLIALARTRGRTQRHNYPERKEHHERLDADRPRRGSGMPLWGAMIRVGHDMWSSDAAQLVVYKESRECTLVGSRTENVCICVASHSHVCGSGLAARLPGHIRRPAVHHEGAVPQEVPTPDTRCDAHEEETESGMSCVFSVAFSRCWCTLSCQGSRSCRAHPTHLPCSPLSHQEARCMLRCFKSGVAAPALYHVDHLTSRLYMEFVDAPTARAVLKSNPGAGRFFV